MLIFYFFISLARGPSIIVRVVKHHTLFHAVFVVTAVSVQNRCGRNTSSVKIRNKCVKIPNVYKLNSSTFYLKSRHLCSSSLNLASSGSFTVAALHKRSAMALARGHNLDSKFVPSTYSVHRAVSPPMISLACSGVPVKLVRGSTL